jgi:competence protein ComEA
MIKVMKKVAAMWLLWASAVALAGPVNVNKADATTLATELSGVGLKKAQAIVAYREENGPFRDIAELAAVKGIGVKLLELNRENVRLTDDLK